MFFSSSFVSSIMSILGSSSNNNNNMGTPFFHEFKKQASFFLKEKIKTARLALTDVTPAELLTEEVTSGNPWAPDTRTMGLISRAAFEVDDYWRVVEILHKRLLKFDRKNWRASYNSLILLEHLLTHGPESVAGEFQSDKDVVREMESFQYIDEKGFNWGLTVRKKSERILKLLEKGPLLKEERDRARKLTREIQGFGSFSQRSSSAQGILKESSIGTYGRRCNSHFNDHGNQDDQNSFSNDGGSTKTGFDKSQQTNEDVILVSGKQTEKNTNSGYNPSDSQMLEKFETRTCLKENMAPSKVLIGKLHEGGRIVESKPLLGDQKDEPGVGNSVEEDHPFNETEKQASAALISSRVQILQGF
ncbi:hypothetical protein L1049_012964 [Liquidambar formosana]|uniref:ENTH domain-containing protein n=1 Tax=Liquidambar formosana TaxID=63359 RepID=A0AAP0RKD4_LIQFO